MGMFRRAVALPIDLLNRRPLFAGSLAVSAGVLVLIGFVVDLLIFRDLDQRLGIDYRQYMDAATRWMHGGPFYLPWQIAAPYPMPQSNYVIETLPVLYPHRHFFFSFHLLWRRSVRHFGG